MSREEEGNGLLVTSESFTVRFTTRGYLRKRPEGVIQSQRVIHCSVVGLRRRYCESYQNFNVVEPLRKLLPTEGVAVY